MALRVILALMCMRANSRTDCKPPTVCYSTQDTMVAKTIKNYSITKNDKIMKKIIITCIMLTAFAVIGFAQDIIVKKDGTILNVYNLEESSSSYFYTLKPSSDATVLKISKDDVFSVKKGDGSTLAAPNAQVEQKISKTTREAVTAHKTSSSRDKKGREIIVAKTPDGHELNYAVLSENDKTLTVVNGEYHEKEYVIPEYVKVDNSVYTVTEIDEKAFWERSKISEIQFPRTLNRIGGNAFAFCRITKIILPEGLEEMGDAAFLGIGWVSDTKWFAKVPNIKEIYIPSSVKSIGKDCFRLCGRELSPGKKCMAFFSNMPDFITEDNSSDFGIDDSAVRSFRSMKKQRAE